MNLPHLKVCVGDSALEQAGALPGATQPLHHLTSPDLTHLRTVTEGENLPLMAQEIYRDPKHYFEVAKANDLDSFRKIDSGQQLQFPPIDKDST